MTPTQREAALRLADELESPGYNATMDEAAALLRELAQEPQAEPVAWHDHVEQRLLTWRQRFMNKSGDQLALDDFMDKESLDDLIDFVCDQYAHPPQQRQPLTDEQITAIVRDAARDSPIRRDGTTSHRIARAVERAHGIGKAD